jgi:hypothetical protein
MAFSFMDGLKRVLEVYRADFQRVLKKSGRQGDSLSG